MFKMILKLLFLFFVLCTVSSKHVNIKDDSYPALQWPDLYNVEATKMYLSAGWVEHFTYWRSLKSSRLDSNDGAVTEIHRIRKAYRSGIKYEIHPETTESELNKMVCYKTIGDPIAPILPMSFLPDPGEFEEQGEEDLRDHYCVKFTNDEDTGEGGTKRTLWAYYDNTTETAAWVPVRYEEQSFNSWHGYFTDHVIMDFYNFEAAIDFSVFKVESPEDCIPKENEDAVDIKSFESVATLKANEEDHLNHVFRTYKKRFNKNYAHDAEHEMRRSIFHKKWRMIEERNRQNLGYKLALNKMSDRTEAEMKRYTGLKKKSSRTVGTVPFPYTQEKLKDLIQNLPTEYDARLEGLVGPVLNQENCGSCYSFGTTAAVEGALARSNGGNLIKLANQAILDCSWGFGNSGCNGGDDQVTYKWVMKYGLPTELEYGTYANQEGFCNIENMTSTHKIRGYTNVTPFSVEALKIALVNHGPLSVSVHVSDAFQSYDQGILYDPGCSTTLLNHEVTLVGFGEKDGEQFWILKNSWGPYWGLGGYINISVRDNNCGVATEPTYVVI